MTSHPVAQPYNHTIKRAFEVNVPVWNRPLPYGERNRSGLVTSPVIRSAEVKFAVVADGTTPNAQMDGDVYRGSGAHGIPLPIPDGQSLIPNLLDVTGGSSSQKYWKDTYRKEAKLLEQEMRARSLNVPTDHVHYCLGGNSCVRRAFSCLVDERSTLR